MDEADRVEFLKELNVKDDDCGLKVCSLDASLPL
jgi:hypothetical protein